MSANAEPVDEFAPASEGLTSGFFRFRYRGTDQVSGQYGPQHSHRLDVLDRETGEKIDDHRHYTPTEMKRGNRQWTMVEAFLGRPIRKDEVIAPAMIRNKVADGEVELNQNGKPKVTTWYAAEQAAPAPTPARPQAALPAPPAPARTVDPATGEVTSAAEPALTGTVAEAAAQPATERQREQIAAILPDYPEGRIDQYCLDHFGVGLAHLTRAQAGQLLVAHMEDAIGPF